eukprot:jgi/Botrbrau1/19334/Bobra.0073s0063.2
MQRLILKLLEMGPTVVVTVLVGWFAVAEGRLTASLASLGLKRMGDLSSYSEPCEGVDCPSYDLDSVEDGYVVRKYPAALWAYRNISGSGFVSAEGKGFEALLRYFGGANKEEEVMGSTEPALTLFHAKDGLSAVINDFTVSFYVPQQYQEGAALPQPLTTDVQVYRTSTAVAYVSNFTGFALEGTILNQARSLSEKLRRDNVDFVEDYFWFATYSPYKQIFHRYNEIWFSKGDEFRSAQLIMPSKAVGSEK